MRSIITPSALGVDEGGGSSTGLTNENSAARGQEVEFPKNNMGEQNKMITVEDSSLVPPTNQGM